MPQAAEQRRPAERPLLSREWQEGLTQQQEGDQEDQRDGAQAAGAEQRKGQAREPDHEEARRVPAEQGGAPLECLGVSRSHRIGTCDRGPPCSPSQDGTKLRSSTTGAQAVGQHSSESHVSRVPAVMSCKEQGTERGTNDSCRTVCRRAGWGCAAGARSRPGCPRRRSGPPPCAGWARWAGPRPAQSGTAPAGRQTGGGNGTRTSGKGGQSIEPIEGPGRPAG